MAFSGRLKRSEGGEILEATQLTGDREGCSECKPSGGLFYQQLFVAPLHLYYYKYLILGQLLRHSRSDAGKIITVGHYDLCQCQQKNAANMTCWAVFDNIWPRIPFK